MARQVTVGKDTDFPEGSMKTIQVEGKKIALAHVDGDWFAIDDTCSHAECSLGSQGFLDGTAVICGCHGAQFDLTTGDVLSPPASSPVASYQVTVVDNQVMISL